MPNSLIVLVSTLGVFLMERSSLLRRALPAIALMVMGWSVFSVLPSASASTLPEVFSISPHGGSTLGGTRVAISGARFAHVKAVFFGSTRGSAIHVVSSTRLLVTSPAHAAGPVNLRVQTSAGTSAIVIRDRFTYIAATNCVFFRNGPGITSTTITLGNASDISGPVPGLFQASQDAVKAYVAYFNATSSFCGRKLRLSTQDTQTTAGGDQVAYQTLCTSAFAAVGSMATYDSGGAPTAQACGLPDIRTASTTAAAHACTTCYAADASNPAYYEDAPFVYFFQQHPTLKQHVAVVYLNTPQTAATATTIHGVLTKLGATNIDMQGVGVTDLTYDAYVQSMQTHGDQYVIFLGPYPDTIKLQQSMHTASFTPQVFIQDPTIYNQAYVQGAQQASVGNGSYAYLNFLPFADAASNHQESTYLAWLHHVAPSAVPNSYGVFAWSAAALFMHEAAQLGGELNRASLLRAVSQVHGWTANAMTASQNVGGKINGSCWRIVQLVSGTWQNTAGYQCDGVTAG